MQDSSHMDSKHDQLQKGIKSASQRLAEMRGLVVKKEGEANHMLDKLERPTGKSNTPAYHIALILIPAANTQGYHHEPQVMPSRNSDLTLSNLLKRPQPTSLSIA
jgi:kinetochore protein NDC80